MSKDRSWRVAYEEDGQPLVAGQKSSNPRRHRAGSMASSCSTSEDSDCYSARDSDKVANEGSSQEEIRRRRSLSSDRGSSVQQQLSHTKSQMKELTDKLSATENTVRLLSRKNKTYLSVLEQAGLATEKLRRSSSETCLSGSPDSHGSSSPNHTAKMRRASRSGSVGTIDVLAGGDHAGVAFSSRLSRSPSKHDRRALPSYSGESIEVGRDAAFDHSERISPSKRLFYSSTIKGSIINESRPQSASDSSSPDSPQRRQHKSPSGTDGTACHDGNGYTDTSQWDQTSRMDQTSRLDHTSSYDMTLHSFINSPMKHNKTLGALADDRHNSTMSGLSKEQLTTRIQHLEHVNVTLREEMRLLERLTAKVSPAPSKTRLQDTATSSGEGVSVGVGISMHINDDEEELLRQHLAEIRRLRQRLEKLDVEKDPDQLLIFQTHFQQRIQRQETIISQLTTQLRENQETWQRELNETQERLTRERNTRVEEMQKNITAQQAHIQELKTKEESSARTVSDMADRLTSCRREREEEVTQMKQERSHLQAQMSKKNADLVQVEDTLVGLEQRLADGDGQIDELKQHLKIGEERERRKEEEVKKLIIDKTELQTDLIKRDRDFLELEESVFKLELAKENAEKDQRRWEEEVQEREKEAGGFRREIEEYKESSRCLKEIVVKRERSLQEKVQTLNRLTTDKAGSDKRVTHQAGQLKQLEGELGALREEVVEHRRWKEECKMMKEDREREEAERKTMTQTLAERTTKLEKRTKQVQYVVEQYKTLEAGYVKLRTTLKQKNDTLKSKERQVEYLDAMATCSSQEEKNTLMKELVKELVATQKQVEDLLGRMEGGSAAPIPTVRVETTGSSQASPGGVSTITTITASPTMHRDLSSISPGASYGLPDPLLCTPPHHGTPTPLAPVSLNEPSLCTPHKSPYKPEVSNVSDVMSMSPSKLTYQADNDTPLPHTGSINPFSINSELRTLFAVFKLQSQETLRKQAGEALVTLSGLEVRVNDRMKVLKAKPMAELYLTEHSIEYSTLRETSLGLANLRVCVQEVCRLASTAWVTELPPLDSRGNFFDPKLESEHQSLQRELTRMMARNDVLEHTIRQQQSRLDTNTERQKNWEASMYRQLYKTTMDLEQAKENIDLGAASHRSTAASDRHHRTDTTHNSSTFNHSSSTYSNNHTSNSNNNGRTRGASPLRQTFFDNSDNL